MMATIEAETINAATVITRDGAAPVAGSGNYEPVRFNAMKHGILSRLAVLAHEDHADMLAALIEEHRPAGMTERHLIEELATIIWRKWRVLLAEGDSVSISGALTPKAWTDRSGESKPSLDMVAHALLTTCHVTRKRLAESGKQASQPAHDTAGDDSFPDDQF